MRPGRRRHQDPQVRPQDAGGQAPASAVRSKYQARTKLMGHSLQAVSLLPFEPPPASSPVPLAVRIHEGLVWSNRDRRTLLDKMLALLGIAAVEQPFLLRLDLPLCRPQDRRRSAQAEQPPAHPDEVQRRRLYRLPAARAAQAEAAPGSMAARSSSAPCGKPPATSNQPQARSTARAR